MPIFPKKSLYYKVLRERIETLVTKHEQKNEFADQDELIKLIRELNSYQIDLEIQNEQLKSTQAELLIAEKNNSQFFEQAPVGYLVLNANAEILKSNYTIHEWLNYSSREFQRHKYFPSLIYPEDLRIFNARFQAFFKRPENKRIELRLQRQHGSPMLVELSGRLIKPYAPQLNGNDPPQLLLNIFDISDHEQLEEELRLAAKVFQNSDEGIMITNHQVRIVKVNPAFTTITGYSAEEVMNRSPSILQSNRHSKDFYRQMWNKINSEGQWQGEIWDQRKDGECYLGLLSINSIVDQNGKTSHFVGIFSDITRRRQAEQQIELMAHYDTLTELPNRVLFNEQLKHSIICATRHNQWVSVLFLDLDRFKTLNDTLGHFMGDLLLQGVAKRLKHCVRESDTVSRFGGDEFVIVLPDFEDEHTAIVRTAEISQNILSELAKPFDLLGNKFTTSTSIGFAFFPKDGHSVSELIKNADVAMYHAKSLGRNNYQSYSDNMREQALTRSSLENDLRSALENNQLLLHYQPIVNLHTLEVIGFEALLRWQHPRLGFIAPDQFIPIAEETGLIIDIGDWVLRRACLQLKRWHDQGKNIKMSVNLSARQFLQYDLFETVQEILDLHDLLPHYLELEITETMIMRNINEITTVLKKLKQLGISISLDDFGTGYSSLTYLKQFPINVVKIDRSFIRDILETQDDQVIVNAIISIAQHMGLDIVTEGIEQSEQVDYLKKQGCHFGQGYFFSIPLAAEDCF